jgi:hypothetical protein
MIAAVGLLIILRTTLTSFTKWLMAEWRSSISEFKVTYFVVFLVEMQGVDVTYWSRQRIEEEVKRIV